MVILGFFSVFLALRLFLIKKNIRSLTRDFRKAKGNLNGEQHLQLSSPDRELEALALLLNDYIEAYFEEGYRHEKSVKSIRNEITNLSHDLRTPVTSILGYLDFIEEGGLTEEQAQALEVVRRRAHDLSGLVEQLYEYARLENEDIPIKMEPVDLYKTVQEHLLSFYPQFERSGIGLELKLPQPRQPVWVVGEHRCMERVMANLTSNALKYSRGSMEVSLKVQSGRAELVYRTTRGELSDYDISHLFDRYYKKDNMRRAAASSGLGLTIARLYTERMGGEMDARGDEDYLFLRCVFMESRGACYQDEP